LLQSAASAGAMGSAQTAQEAAKPMRKPKRVRM
jgi:hypothetical protein